MNNEVGDEMDTAMHVSTSYLPMSLRRVLVVVSGREGGREGGG